MEGKAMTLRELRENAILKQAELAAVANLSRVSLSRWESGLRIPGPDFINKLAKALGVTPQDVLQAARESKRLYQESQKNA